VSFAAVVYFEENHEEEFLRIWESLSAENLTANLAEAEIRPHITLAIFDELNCRPCDSQLANVAAHTRPISFQITHLGLFTKPEPVVFAAPTITQELLSFHKDIHETLAAEAKNPWEMYMPGQWVPHCTLALGFDLKNLGRIFEKCLGLGLPLHAQADQVGIVEFQPMKDVFKFRLISD
jgi:2'-5' RNA ligase